MDNNIFNEIPTKLDLNGPIVSYTEQPTGGTGIGTTTGMTGGGTLTFTGIATAVVGNGGTGGTGYLSYQWYEVNVGKLSDTTYLTGTASTGPVGTAATLTLANLITPTDNQRKFYLETDYVPSYVVGVQSVTRAGYRTGNASNEPLNSGIATATVLPLIEIVAQPTQGTQALINEDAQIIVNSDLTDNYFADDLIYQWYLNGELVEDGVKTVTTTTSSTVKGLVDKTYTRDGEVTIPATATDVEITICGAKGGSGGRDAGGPGGAGGNGMCGKFSVIMPDTSQKDVGWRIGHRGNSGTSGGHSAGGEEGHVPGPDSGMDGGDGGHGGGAGQHGWSGGGGGGGAASNFRDISNGMIIVAAGGGGGGGGSWNRGGFSGNDANPFEIYSAYLKADDGNQGGTKSGDGGGGGGGGGGGAGQGSPAGGGPAGSSGTDNDKGGSGGGGGKGAYTSGEVTFMSQWLNDGDGYAHLKYESTTLTEITTVKKTTLSGTTSNTLTISADTVGVQTCQCKITSATASNSPMWTDVVNFAATSTIDQYNINVEAIGIGRTASLSSINLANGEYTFNTTQSQVDSGGINKYYSFYSPDKDINVEVDLYGGKGDNKGSYQGGEGGYSRIRFKMGIGDEYVIVGLSSDINAPYLYRKGRLVACVGRGGDAGISGDGGAGGGVENKGQDGGGRDAGVGGYAVEADGLWHDGIFGSNYPSPVLYPNDTQAGDRDGGRSMRCSKGVFWAQRGVPACADITREYDTSDGLNGETRFRLPDGKKVDNSAIIVRGFKPGYTIIETGGAKDANGGRGGNGATGGQGGSSGGGGGGSGYNDGSVTVVDTQQSGSVGDAKVILRVVS